MSSSNTDEVMADAPAPETPAPVIDPAEQAKKAALVSYRRKLLEHRELEAKVKHSRKQLAKLDKDYDKSEDDLKALQSVGQIIGEVLKQLDEERFIVKASSGPRYVVGCRRQVSASIHVYATINWRW
ncbi:hypothetical protein SARC_15991 [Sphaeroforma arctica JP610]|uniref:Proteasomal ATPase second OB domain-containing protein n=1 Tax=Sphaeroforma arctica JP610 TaxID=667725 RepID=A0A0L0F5M5_9EUKA|nr:hypothetical protein SARC_15991 [Sphaeroforma arctica JP610]KNC71468.1 hypothetical protein SARC_15991 [Sphaeroforma arctica JP610]|eukprot:XP_014145370.1 hypothetical protein SARC_15991 [Sphaeroforma arctica JP610]